MQHNRLHQLLTHVAPLLPCSQIEDSVTARRGSWSLLLASVLTSVAYSGAPAEELSVAPECATAEACLALVPQVAGKGNGISQTQDELATRIQSFEAESIPGLIALLEDPDPGTRKFAAYTLRDIEGLGPDHVSPIFQAAMKEKSGGWLPPALARIGTPEAVAGLVALLRKYPQPYTQITFAFERLGAKSVPALLPLLFENDSDDELFMVVGHIFVELGPESQEAALPLAEMVDDQERPEVARMTALNLLGAMGPAAEPARDILMSLRSRGDGAMKREVTGALFEIGGSGLGDVYAEMLAPPDVPFDGVVTDLLEQLGFSDQEARLIHVAGLGKRARDAVPAVLKLLYDPNPGIRVSAARTLGFIADSSVGSDLVSFINDEDWLMVRVVAESLGRIRYESARPELSLVASAHWYPPVRKIASDALAALDGEYGYDAMDRSGNLYFSFNPKTFPIPTPKACATLQNTPEKQSGSERFYSDQSPELAKKFQYQAEMYGYDESGRVTETFSQDAQVGLRGPKGWFLGASRGEFGGELVWRPDRGADQIVVRDNIEDIYELLPGRFVTTAGLAHLGFDSGQIYKLEQSQNRWLARWWRRLPGEPMSSWVTEKDEIIINTTGGSVLLDRNGSLRMAPCTASDAQREPDA